MSVDRHPLCLAYISERYPHVTTTFITREVAALRAQSVAVETLSVDRPPPSEIAERDEAEGTAYLRPAALIDVLLAHAAILARSPARYGRALRLTARTAPAGLDGLAHQISAFALAGVVARHVSRREVQHLHSQGTAMSCTVAMLAAALADVEFSLTVHGPGVFVAPRARRLDAKLRHARFVRCVSNFTRSQCFPWAEPEQWSRLHVVHCGVDPGRYAAREHRGSGSHLLFVGRLVPEKGLPVLVDALARLRSRRPPPELTIVGDGPERAAIAGRARAAGLSDRVRFTGYQTPDQVEDWLRRTDVLALPSFAEGVPVVLMEAMASGVPVVATSVGGIGELVADGVNGFLVPAGAPAPLAERILALLNDPELRCRLGRAGRETVARDFSLHREAGRLRSLFQKALEGGLAPPQTSATRREVLR